MQSLSRWVVCMCIAALPARAAWSDVVFEVRGDGFTTTSPVSVFVCGSFNDWSVTATPMSLGDGVWRATVALPDGRHFYNFVWRDGANVLHKQLLDPTNPFVGPSDPFLGKGGRSRTANFIDVLDGRRVALTDGLEKFEWRDASAREVKVTGDFKIDANKKYPLARQEDGSFVAYVPVARPFNYRFIVDGRSQPDALENGARLKDVFGVPESFRAAATITSPTSKVLARLVVAGDTRPLEEVKALAEAGDYGNAVALARKATETNIAAGQPALAAAALWGEQAVHFRWQRRDEAAACWKRIVELDVACDETYKALGRLAWHYGAIAPDPVEAHRYIVMAFARARSPADLEDAAQCELRLLLRESDTKATLAFVDRMLEMVPEPTGKNPVWSMQAYCNLLLAKGAACTALREMDKARSAYEQIVTLYPDPRDPNRQGACLWLQKRGFPIPSAEVRP